MFNEQQINDAKKRLEKCFDKDGVLLISQYELKNLNFIVSGNKDVESPEEPYYSNKTFFHLKDIICHLTIRYKRYEGIFNHEDYSLIYEFKNNEETFYFNSSEKFSGTLEYKNYKPYKLFLFTNCYPSTREILLANNSLTSSNL